ncbi:hypothetical protein BDZ91DRAFT_798985 [Kalaharituber pfeilii]|nr:hypothetical protein BDZ91DRAFT_798985 [Kalaharituber pfeilii]
MSEAPQSKTPRLSEISSVESSRNSLDQAPSTTATSLSTSSQQSQIPNPSYDFMGKKPSPRILEENRVRRSPDSEALASSDDETEHHALSYFPQVKGLNSLSSRRPSYAAEFQNRSRTYSVLGGGALSPTASHPTTPSGDTTAWAAALTAANGSTQPFNLNWGGSIWNTDSRKSPPKPINVRSASISGPSAPSPLFVGSEALPSPTTISANTTEFPIPIPLQPQLRNYRSMSFSVGQRELEDHTKARLSPPTMLGSRGLQHRPSRPSLLSEEHYAGSSSPLRSVFETEDDEYAGRDGLQQSNDYVSQPPPRHRFMSVGYDNSRLRSRSASTTTIPTVSLTTSNGSFFSTRDGERVMPLEEESALVEDEDDFDIQQRRLNGRSMSMMHSSAEGQRLDTLRRQYWQSVGGTFGGIGELGNQSRRHSFAAFAANDTTGDYDLAGSQDSEIGLNNGIGLGTGRDRYLDDARGRPRQGLLAPQSTIGPASSTPPAQHSLQPYPTPPRIIQQPSPPPAGPHRSLMGMHSHLAPQQRPHQLLYLVSFKACRADVFYVQEGTGLRVRKGDLVIVEADRGTDLGTVIHENITWQQAKEYKEHYAKEHLAWLMMFATRRVGTAATASVNGPTTQSQFSNGAASVSASQMPLNQDTASSMELKPKMIKRLAQVHEIQTLRDKEANEAKAKRVCQQKVLEHRLPMEILDAEFQMDWKKLTFYYFADSYINFNSLVTDLFKVYKTRIWMSAMNPASFAHPNTGASAGDASTEQTQHLIHNPLSGLNPYSQIPPNSQQNPLVRLPYQTMTQPAPNNLHGPAFPPRAPVVSHADYGHLQQQQNNGYTSQYINGAGSGPHQSAITNGSSGGVIGAASGNMSGTGPDWMTLQGLSLQSH